MLIEKIHFEKFRVFEDIRIDLGTNISCIAGYNGVGKSTLLAILSNIGELKKERGSHINGNAFRGDFSSIIHGEQPYDTTGKKCTIYFSKTPSKVEGDNLIPNTLEFRSTFQTKNKKETFPKKVKAILDGETEQREITILESREIKGAERYRLLPVQTDERKTVSKIPWPTYYLGLSRLYPIGESEEVHSKNNIPVEILEELMIQHRKILTSNDDYLESSSIEISDTKKKKGFGVKTKEYSEKMNSSGQDNLGQILSSVYSFKMLKDTLGEDYIGGLLLIDEIDATLHPVAQNKLLDFLYQKSKELEIQIVFTTHSISLLEHVVKKQNIIKDKKEIQMIYLTKKRNKLEVICNPDKVYLHNDLMQTYSGATSSRKVSVFTEDDTARWFLKKIIEYNNTTYPFDLNLIDMTTGWTEIIKLIKNDFSYYRNHLVILDPDLNSKQSMEDLQNHLKGTQYKIQNKGSNILILPGNEYIEKIFWTYLESLEPDAEFFYNSKIDASGLSKQTLLDFGPKSEEYSKFSNEKKQIKSWFEQNSWICEIAFDYWIKEDANEEKVAYFMNSLIKSYEPIYHRLR
ncbi:ATP-binding protein [Viridibacillus sp. FSL H8-0123]|uniref:ATP-dependent nuclease n=1 Tax=Viridibacillus sp. FSL H8-0123 TaxID=1928922 RepID=UPI00096C52DB|nr:ATP-binding protein [Viridibacillus sp. FSL H8-0123]OMC83326.1 hypothetical protein BK130_07190 [Viridibacillus sp. FSL H8-0123]